jgi:hypothetical protein
MGLHQTRKLLHSKGKNTIMKRQPTNGTKYLPVIHQVRTNNQSIEGAQKTKLKKN